MNILFFGSTSDSVVVLERLTDVVAVVTQPPRPIGRKQEVTPTPVETWARKHNIPVLTFPSNPMKPWLFADEEAVSDTLAPFKADIIISASYGIKIPDRTIKEAHFGGINVHPSILPRWRGADPVPWAILSGDHQIGVTLVTLSERFDEGKILAQKKIPITNTDTSDPLRTKLFTIGRELLISILPDYLSHKPITRYPPFPTESSYARKFTRDDGFEPWEKLMDPKEAPRINRKFRALHPWPGLWTLFHNKRLKILAFDHAPTQVQLEGKKPVSFPQFAKAYLSDTT